MPMHHQEDIDDSRWVSQRFLINGKPSTPSEVSLHTITCPPREHTKTKGHVLLIHGFPQTSYQFRRVITPLADAGYHVIVPDYRGAGSSSKPADGYDKFTMANDLHELVTKHLKISEKIHVVGHDIGGMVACAFALRFADSTASLTWGECPLPGTEGYEKALREQMHGGVWHFAFHWQPDIPEMLVSGRERQYIRSFYDRLSKQPLAISDKDTDYYALSFAQPGALRAGFGLYRSFHQDAEDNKKWVEKNGKSKVPCLTLNGDGSFLATIAGLQAKEVFESFEERQVPQSGHYIAEENPAAFVKNVLDWAEQHGSQ